MAAPVLLRPTFETLYAVAQSYLPAALALLGARRCDVDDLIHDIVLAAHEGLERRGGVLEPVEAGAKAEQTIKAWLSGVAWRLLSNRRRRGYHRFELCCGDGTDHLVAPDEPPSAEQLTALRQRYELIRQILARLLPERAKVLLMVMFMEMTTAGAADALGINENTVKSRLGRARSDFKAAMKSLRPDEQTALRGSPLLIPFGLGDWQRSPRSAPGGGPVALALGAMVMLAVGFGAGWSARGREAGEPPSIVAAREAWPVTGAPSATVPAVSSATSATPQPTAASASHPRTPPAADTLAEEQLRMEAAHRALRDREYGRALALLSSHEREFPRGKLARDREWLRGEVLGAMGAAAASTPAE